MDNKFDIDGLTRETKRREYEDGLRDFQLGAIFLLVGLANWFIFTPAGLDLFARTVLRLGDLLLPAFLGFVGLFFLGLFGSERIMAQIRRATFWKESGFVKPLRSGVIKIGATVLAAVVLLGIIIGSVWLMARGILSQEAALRSIPASVGLGTAIIFTSLGLTLQMRRYILVGVSGAILSGIILLADITFATSYLWAWAIRDLRGRAING
jgi:hypothetical protein